MLDGLENNTKRFVKIFSEAADDAMPAPTELGLEEDMYDILYNQVRGLAVVEQISNVKNVNALQSAPSKLLNSFNSCTAEEEASGGPPSRGTGGVPPSLLQTLSSILSVCSV